MAPQSTARADPPAADNALIAWRVSHLMGIVDPRAADRVDSDPMDHLPMATDDQVRVPSDRTAVTAHRQKATAASDRENRVPGEMMVRLQKVTADRARADHDRFATRAHLETAIADPPLLDLASSATMVPGPRVPAARVPADSAASVTRAHQ